MFILMIKPSNKQRFVLERTVILSDEILKQDRCNINCFRFFSIIEPQRYVFIFHRQQKKCFWHILKINKTKKETINPLTSSYH